MPRSKPCILPAHSSKLPQWGGEVLVTMSYPLSGCTWQWERSADGVTWEQLEGETASSHVIEPAYSGCYYRCVVTNTYGNELVVDLGQQYRFMITEQPSGVTVAAGSEATFTAKTNWESTHWQWQVSTDGGSTWSKIGEEQKSGAESVLTLTAEEAMNGNLYRCEIADAAGKYGYTEPAVLTVGVPTVPLSYTLDGIVLRDQSTNAVLSAIPSGSFLAELTVSNVSADTGATFVLVTYDADGMMLDMSYFIAHPAIGDSMTFGALVKNDGGAARIQAMALTSLGELIPLAESIEYPAVN